MGGQTERATPLPNSPMCAIGKDRMHRSITFSMSTGNWSSGPHVGHSNAGNSMAAAVAVKTGVLQQLTNFNIAPREAGDPLTPAVVCAVARAARVHSA